MGEALLMNRSQEWNPEYTYTGDCTFTDEGNGNWNIKFTSSGTFMFIQPNSARRGIDVFLVGGGGGCANTTYFVYSAGTQYGARSGGGGGYTTTVTDIEVFRRTPYTIIVGAGGKANATSGNNGWMYGADGGQSSAFNCTAAGGKGGRSQCYKPNTESETNTSTPGAGGSGGSGGVGYGNGNIGGNYPTPATNGNPGSKIGGSGNGGAGQGTTTKEFGEENGTMYSAGGGRGTSVTVNTGNGGFSTCDQGQVSSHPEANGASGIVIIRNHRE